MADDPTATAATKTLRFALRIETELGAGDEAMPAVEYVTEWLNDNGYGYVVIEEPKVSDA